MDSYQKEKAKQKILEMIFEYAGLCHVENIVNEIEEDKEYCSNKQIYFPEELDKKMREIIDNYSENTNCRKSRKAFKKALPKVAAILVVVFTITTVFVANVGAIRAKVLNFMMEETEKYTSVDIKEEPNILKNNPEIIPPDWKGLYAPTYIPEGFRVTSAKNYEDVTSIVYINDAGQMILFEKFIRKDTNLRVDTEDTNAVPIEIKGFEGLLTEKNDITKIIWYNDDFLFSLTSKIDKNELMKIAESVELAK